jgi:hypothetical protein
MASKSVDPDPDFNFGLDLDGQIEGQLGHARSAAACARLASRPHNSRSNLIRR